MPRQDDTAITPVIVTPPDSLDIYTAADLREELRDAIEKPGPAVILLDLDATGYLDMTGLGVIATAHHRAARHRRRFAVVCTQEPILRKLRATGLNHVVDIRDNTEGAPGADD